MRVNLPTALTLFRIFLVPLLVVVLLTPPWTTAWVRDQVRDLDSVRWTGDLVAWLSAWREIIAVGIFLLAAATDWLDGYLARRLNQTSSFGAFLDPVADKFLVCAALLVLVHLDRIDVFVALIIIGREIAISALREWMAHIGASRSVAVHMLGKLKTTAQMIAIPFLLFDGELFGVIDTHVWGSVLIWIAAVLTIWSMIYYLQRALPEIRAKAR